MLRCLRPVVELLNDFCFRSFSAVFCGVEDFNCCPAGGDCVVCCVGTGCFGVTSVTPAAVSKSVVAAFGCCGTAAVVEGCTETGAGVVDWTAFEDCTGAGGCVVTVGVVGNGVIG